jgi:hypothetical protein
MPEPLSREELKELSATGDWVQVIEDLLARVEELEREADADLREFISFAEKLPDTLGPCFGRDAARIARSLAQARAREEGLREAGDKLFAAMPKRSSIWDTFREENIAAMRDALTAWASLPPEGPAGIPVQIDPSIEPGTIEVRRDGETVARIVNVEGPAASEGESA